MISKKLVLLLMALALVAASCGDDAESTTTAATTTVAPATTAATTTAAPTTTEATTTTTEAMAAIGSPENPIQVMFVPSVSAQQITSGGEIMADALNSATGLEFEVVVPTSYAATIEAMCAAPDTSMGFIPGLGYVLANELCGVDVAFAAVRFGLDVYYAQFIVQRDSGIESIADLDGLTWAYPDPGSTSGYLAPLPMLEAAGVTVAEEVTGLGHTGTVRAVYNGEADFGTTFFSPPLLPEGSWAYGDEPDVSDELASQCEVTAEDRLFCGDIRILDARAGLRSEAPDVIEKVKILDISVPIPNDTLSFGPEFPADLRTQIVDALIAFAETDEWSESIGHPDFYDWSGLAPTNDAAYDPVRLSIQAAGITLEDLGE
jgi:phosphonate transport system substrate-binding protein